MTDETLSGGARLPLAPGLDRPIGAFDGLAREFKTFARESGIPLERRSVIDTVSERVDPQLVALWAMARGLNRDDGFTLELPEEVTGIRLFAEPGGRGTLLDALAGLGVTATGSGRVLSVDLPLDRLPELSNLPGLANVALEIATTHAGAALSQGVAAMEIGPDGFADAYRVDGRGVSVGIISDSFDTDGETTGSVVNSPVDYADDIATGDLPPPNGPGEEGTPGVRILQDLADGDVATDPNAINTIDEGRAMAQLIHDVAPGAELVFHTGFPGASAMVTAIGTLAADPFVDVIVDDLGFLLEPFYMDGQIAQAADAAFAAGVPYLSSAGNSANRAYSSEFRPSGFTVTGNSVAHDFDPGPDVDVFQRIVVQPGESIAPLLQWATPFLSATGSVGAGTDLNLFLVNDPPSSILASATANEIGQDGFTFAGGLTNNGTTAAAVNIVIEGVAGTIPPQIGYIQAFGSSPVDIRTAEFATSTGSSFGHPSAEGALGIGAADYRETPAFGPDPAILESFSSTGGLGIYHAADGTLLPAPEERERVDLVGPNGTDTTFFGFDVEPNGFPNFFGTSASAPHVAAVVALLLEIDPQLAPTEIYDALRLSADGMDDPYTTGDDGDPELVDLATGHGYIDPEGALALLTDLQTGDVASNRLVGDGNADNVDVLRGLAGRDLLLGRGGRDRLLGDEDDDILDGGADADVLFGGPGDDRLQAGPGDDRLVGDAGSDTLFGGPGADSFVLTTTDGVDRISDYEPGIDLVMIAGGLDPVEIATDPVIGGTNILHSGTPIARVADATLALSDLVDADGDPFAMMLT